MVVASGESTTCWTKKLPVR